MSKICIWGASLNKVDDEAQVIAAVSLIKKRFPSTQITFFSNYGNRLADFIAKEGVAVEVITNPHPGRVARSIMNARVFLILGGVLSETPLQALRSAILLSMARAFRCPVVAWQLSVFPQTSRWGIFIFKRIFEQMDLICAREPMGAEIIKRLGVTRPVRVFADSRLLLEPCSPVEVRTLLGKEGIDPYEPLIGLSTRYVHAQMPAWVKRTHSYADQVAEQANDALARVVAHLGKLAQVVMIPMHPTYREDQCTFEWVSRYTDDRGRPRLLSHRYSAREIIGIIAQCDLLLASRLGSAVFAAATETPIIAIAYEPRMLEHMERIGLGDCVFDWRQLNSDALIMAIDRVWRAPRPRRNSAQVAGLKAQAEESVEALSGFLS